MVVNEVKGGGQMFMIGGFVVYYLYGLFGVNYFVSLIAVVFVLGVIGWCFERFFFRRMRKIATREENSMLLAVVTALLLENLALSSFGEKQRGVPPVVSGVFKIGDAFLPAGCWSWFLLSSSSPAFSCSFNIQSWAARCAPWRRIGR